MLQDTKPACGHRSREVLPTGDIQTRGSHKLRQQQARKEAYRSSFFPRSVRDWNRVPKPVTAASTIEKLRTRPAIVPWTQLQAQ